VRCTDSNADFFVMKPIASFGVVGIRLSSGGFEMTARPFVSRLSVFTAYAAIALVGAIVLGVF
jgi:hypothetical protein